ncbi:K10B2.2, partial [Symbiodinium pilosum]
GASNNGVLRVAAVLALVSLPPVCASADVPLPLDPHICGVSARCYSRSEKCLRPVCCG